MDDELSEAHELSPDDLLAMFEAGEPVEAETAGYRHWERWVLTGSQADILYRVGDAKFVVQIKSRQFPFEPPEWVQLGACSWSDSEARDVHVSEPDLTVA